MLVVKYFFSNLFFPCFFITDKPQPSSEYPIVLFSGTNYDSISNNGYYTRLKEDEYIVWGRTVADEKRDFRYRSLIVLPGRQLKFKGTVHCSSALVQTPF